MKIRSTFQWRGLGWLRGHDGLDQAAERFLATSNDLADLERRLRALERGGMPVMAVTFNH